MLFSEAKSRRFRSRWEIRNDKLLLFYMFAWSFALLAAVPVAMLVNGETQYFLQDIWRIFTSPSKLVTDYFNIGGLSSTFFNAGLCGLACSLVLLVSRIDPNARMLAGYFLVIAHCFYGLNLFNMWPPFIGVLVYSIVRKRRFSEEVHIAMFATSLGPFISDFMFRYTLGDKYEFDHPQTTVLGVSLAIIFGLATGFVIPALLDGTTKMHRGYNLYKAGLAIGLLGVFVYALLYKTMGITPPDPPVRDNPIYSSHNNSYGLFVTVFLSIMFLSSIIWGFILNGKTFKGYKNLFFSSGHNMDFSELYGTPLCMVNFGIYGFCILAYLHIIINLTEGAGFTGPTMGVILAALTFAAAGQTIRNVFPIVIGYSVLWGACNAISLLLNIPVTWSLSTQGYINGIAFATGLCPFAGKYGWKVGILAGLVDAIVCTSTVAMHGGFVLYNGGFAAGLTALVLVPILDFYNVKIKHETEPEPLEK